MAIIAALKRESGSLDEERTGNTTFTQLYVIRDDAGAIISAAQIKAANVLPTYNTKLSGTNAYVTSISLGPRGSTPEVWDAVVTFKTKEQTEVSDDPLKFNAMVDFDTVPMTYVIDKAYDTADSQGSPSLDVLNTAGDPFDPPMTGERQLDLIIVEKNYASFDPADCKKYRDTINKGQITIGGIPIADGNGWMRLVKMRTQFKVDGTAYSRVRFEILINDESWNRKPLSIGYYQYVSGVNTNKKPIMTSDISSAIAAGDDDDVPVTEPQRLGSNGALIAAATSPHFMNYQVMYKRGWRDLNLPTRQDGRT